MECSGLGRQSLYTRRSIGQLNACDWVCEIAVKVVADRFAIGDRSRRGVIPGARHLVITDGLRELLSHRQMTMVILHELAHLRRGHMFFRLAAVLPVWVVVGVCHWLWPNEPMAATVGMVGGGVTALVMLRLLSHATEFDADQTACRFAVQLAGSGIPDVPSSLADAARELTSALHALTAGDIRAQRATWLHPSLAHGSSACMALPVQALRLELEVCGRQKFLDCTSSCGFGPPIARCGVLRDVARYATPPTSVLEPLCLPRSSIVYLAVLTQHWRIARTCVQVM